MLGCVAPKAIAGINQAKTPKSIERITPPL